MDDQELYEEQFEREERRRRARHQQMQFWSNYERKLIQLKRKYDDPIGEARAKRLREHDNEELSHKVIKMDIHH